MWNQHCPLARAFWLIFSFLLGCSPVTPTPSLPENIHPPTPLSTQIISAKPAWTATPTNPSPTLSALSDSHLKFQDLRIFSSIPEDVHLNGTLVLVSPFDYLSHTLGEYKQNQLILWNLATRAKQKLLEEDEYFSHSAVSPNQQWLAYTKNKPHNGIDNYFTVIVNANGKQQAFIPWKKGWGGISAWLDTKNLIIRRPLIITMDARSYATALLVLNPFTNEMQNLPADPSDMYVLSVHALWEDIGEISYNPTLTHRVYPNMDHELVLEDLQTGQVLLHFPATIIYSVPRWSPDGSQFIISNAENFNSTDFPKNIELYSITKAGQKTRLTYISNYFPSTFISDYAWSPDGSKIAFLLSTNDSKLGVRIAVYEVKTKDVTIYNNASEVGDSWYTRPIWSPDNRQLLIGIGNHRNVTGENVLVIDLVDAWAAQVAKDVYPMGWMSVEK